MPTYADQIDEVFIKPIRSVLVVDDQFPRMEKLLSGVNLDKYDVGRLSDLLKFCRKEGPQWLVDVHDGKGLDRRKFPYSSLRQSDWLILDYNLSNDHNDGKIAIDVVRRLAASDNFNLVVIYTAKDPSEVFREVITSISSKLRKEIQLTKEEQISLDAAIEEAEFAGILDEDELEKEVTLNVCLELLRNGFHVRSPANQEILASFQKRLVGTKLVAFDLQKLLLKKLVLTRIQKLRSFEGALFDLEFSNSGTDTKWFLAANVFVTIVSKEESAPKDLLKELKKSLRNWHPSPNWLILAKLRSELDAAGIRVERQIFLDAALQAFWLMELLKTKDSERNHYIGGLLDRQTEEITDILRTNVTEFAERVVKDTLSSGADCVDITKGFWGVDPLEANKRIEGLIAHNTHVSTKRPHGKNLMPGHVLRIEADELEYWVCLSAACDLEAGREDNGRDLKKRIFPWMPFTAVKIHSEKSSTALKNATQGYSLFLNIDGRKLQFSIFPDSNPIGSPVWEEFHAQNEGRISVNKPFNLARTSAQARKGSLPSFKKIQTQIVAQLRTEYATKLAVRLTHHLSRVGLDFMAADAKEKQPA